MLDTKIYLNNTTREQFFDWLHEHAQPKIYPFIENPEDPYGVLEEPQREWAELRGELVDADSKMIELLLEGTDPEGLEIKGGLWFHIDRPSIAKNGHEAEIVGQLVESDGRPVADAAPYTLATIHTSQVGSRLKVTIAWRKGFLWVYGYFRLFFGEIAQDWPETTATINAEPGLMEVASGIEQAPAISQGKIRGRPDNPRMVRTLRLVRHNDSEDEVREKWLALAASKQLSASGMNVASDILKRMQEEELATDTSPANTDQTVNSNQSKMANREGSKEADLSKQSGFNATRGTNAQATKPQARTIEAIKTLINNREEEITQGRQIPTWVRACQDAKLRPETAKKHHPELHQKWEQKDYRPNAVKWETKICEFYEL